MGPVGVNPRSMASLNRVESCGLGAERRRASRRKFRTGEKSIRLFDGWKALDWNRKDRPVNWLKFRIFAIWRGYKKK